MHKYCSLLTLDIEPFPQRTLDNNGTFIVNNASKQNVNSLVGRASLIKLLLGGRHSYHQTQRKGKGKGKHTILHKSIKH